MEILGELWFKYQNEESFADFFSYNVIGLPLSYLVNEGLATLEPSGEIYVNETYDILIESLEADKDAEYESLQDLLERFAQ